MENNLHNLGLFDIMKSIKIDGFPDFSLEEIFDAEYKEKYSILQVGTGDSPLTVPFYEKCGFVRSHSIKNFFTDNYDHPIYECGVQLVDMIYLRRTM